MKLKPKTPEYGISQTPDMPKDEAQNISDFKQCLIWADWTSPINVLLFPERTFLADKGRIDAYTARRVVRKYGRPKSSKSSSNSSSSPSSS